MIEIKFLENFEKMITKNKMKNKLTQIKITNFFNNNQNLMFEDISNNENINQLNNHQNNQSNKNSQSNEKFKLKIFIDYIWLLSFILHFGENNFDYFLQNDFIFIIKDLIRRLDSFNSFKFEFLFLNFWNSNIFIMNSFCHILFLQNIFEDFYTKINYLANSFIIEERNISQIEQIYSNSSLYVENDLKKIFVFFKKVLISCQVDSSVEILIALNNFLYFAFSKDLLVQIYSFVCSHSDFNMIDFINRIEHAMINFQFMIIQETLNFILECFKSTDTFLNFTSLGQKIYNQSGPQSSSKNESNGIYIQYEASSHNFQTKKDKLSHELNIFLSSLFKFPFHLHSQTSTDPFNEVIFFEQLQKSIDPTISNEFQNYYVSIKNNFITK